MSESKILRSLLCMCIITILYLGAIGLCRTVIFSTILKIDDKVINYVSLGIYTLIFIFGPFSLPFLQKVLAKFTYKAVFFTTSVANVISMFLYVLIIEQKPRDGYIIALILLIEAIAAPFMSMFYCTFNYYIRNISNRNTVGTNFGLAYSLFCMQNFFGDIFIQFAEEIFEYNQYFYYPMLGLSLFITFFYWLIYEPQQLSKNVTESIDLEDKLNKHLYGSSLEDDQEEINKKQELSYIIQLKKIWSIPKQYSEFKYLLMSILSIGLYSAFNVVFSQDMIEPNFINQNLQQIQKKLTINMSIHGVGQFLGGITFGLFSNIYGNLNLLLILQIFAIITFILSVIQLFQIRIVGEVNELKQDNISIVYTFNFMSGILISATQTLVFSYCGSEYLDNQNVLQLCNWLYCLSFYFCTIFMSLPNIPGMTDNTLMISISVCGGFIILYSFINLFCLWQHKRKILFLRENQQ